MRIIKQVTKEYYELVLEFVKQVFVDSEGEESGNLVKELVKEIRSKQYYIPELDLIMVDENNEIIGYTLFSKFHIEGKYENELILLSPVAVKTSHQRQHISKELIEYGFNKAIELGYKVCLVEGNPQNYRSRGFVTSKEYGIIAHESIGLPAVECLMVKELVKDSLKNIKGVVSYDIYETLK